MLIDKVTDDTCMELVILIFLVLVGPLAIIAGADSRITDTRDTRGWFPSARPR